MRTVYLLPLALLLTGCELFGVGEAGSVYARTSQETYRPGEPVTFSIVNASGESASFASCGKLDYFLERREGKTWRDAGGTWPSICMFVVTLPVEIPPQDAYEGEVTVSSPGTYRLGFVRSVEGNVEEVYTNTFRVSVPSR